MRQRSKPHMHFLLVCENVLNNKTDCTAFVDIVCTIECLLQITANSQVGGFNEQV